VSGCLQHSRAPQFLESAAEILCCLHWPEGWDREAVLREKSLFAHSVLGNVQNRSVGTNWSGLSRCGRCGSWNILEFESHDTDRSSEFPNGSEVLVRGCDLDVGYLSCRSVRLRGKGVNAIAHSSGRNGKHASQLSAAQDSDRGARKDLFGRGDQ